MVVTSRGGVLLGKFAKLIRQEFYEFPSMFQRPLPFSAEAA
jgi:hypothetical protein